MSEEGNLTSYQPLPQTDKMPEPEESRLTINPAQAAYGATDSSGENGSESDSEAPNKKQGLGIRHGGSSNFSTIMHIIKGNVGTGILAMPSAFSQAGILVGTVGLVLLGIICIHCMHILVNISHYLCAKLSRPFMSYADVAEESFNYCSPKLSRRSKAARTTVNVFLLITQFGFCCVYVLFVAQNLQYVVMKLMHNVGPDCDPHSPMVLQVYEICVMALLIPFVFIRKIKYLAPFSTLANIASMIGLGIILYDILIAEGLNKMSRLPLFTDWEKLPVYFGTAIYAFEGIGVVLPLENKMREPKAFPSLFGVLNLGMVVVCVLYITIGFYGYIEYGNDAQGSITLNLKSWYGILVQLLFSFCIFVSYGIQFFVPMEILGSKIQETKFADLVGGRIADYIFRAVLVIITFAIAAIVDRYLDLLISLIGSLASAALALIFPPLLEIITYWPERRNISNYWLMFAKDIAIITLGITGFFAGTGVTIQRLVVSLGSHDNTNGCPNA